MARGRHSGGTPVAVGYQLGLSLELVQISLVTHVHLPGVAQHYPAGNGSPCLRSTDRTGQGSRLIGGPFRGQGGRRWDAKRPPAGEHVERARRVDYGPIAARVARAVTVAPSAPTLGPTLVPFRLGTVTTNAASYPCLENCLDVEKPCNSPSVPAT